MKRVLLIEEHALFRESLALLLDWRLGLESIEAGSLDEGRRVLSAVEGIADIAIIDLDLPNGDGTDLIERLHETDPEIPILAFTAEWSLAKRTRALEAGAHELLAKMTTVEQIIGVAERLVGG